MKYGLLFSALAVALAALAFSRGGWNWLLLWPAICFSVLTAGYFQLGARIFGKSADGALSPVARFVLLPYLLCLWSLWNVLQWMKREPAFHQLTENIWIGRRLVGCELPETIQHVVDLTSEFRRPRSSRNVVYRSYPILDASAPSANQLVQWADEVTMLTGSVYIHCAEGHGRTGLFSSFLLFRLGQFPTPEESLRFVQSKRPLVRLSRYQWTILSQAARIISSGQNENGGGGSPHPAPVTSPMARLVSDAAPTPGGS